jgi:hypothetical protein
MLPGVRYLHSAGLDDIPTGDSETSAMINSLLRAGGTIAITTLL